MNIMPPSYNDVVNFFSSYGFNLHTIAPLIVISTFLFLAIRKSIHDNIDKMSHRVIDIEGCVIEIQTLLTNENKLTFQRTVSAYGQAHSPVVLKDEFRHFVTDTNLEKQIEEKKKDLVELLEKQKPKTGLDAQDTIAKLVITGEIGSILDLNEFKQNLYKKGKTSIDANGILGVYLFEILIPELHLNGKQ